MRTAFILVTLLSVSQIEEVENWRRGGQPAVDQLYAKANGEPSEQLDRVCGQKDCHTSRLFWYTDLAEAQDAARTLGRPILALHLLGRLDEELSCANSRFFRVMLYSDPQISALMRDRYVLYWHSVRPVPQVTIDMGDGRKIRQTITGNSVHYLLDADGNVLDALPGLRSPQAFRAQLVEWLRVDGGTLNEYHSSRASRVFAPTVYKPTAVDASARTMSKMATERPLLRQLTLGVRLPVIESAELGSDVVFSEPSLALMRTKQPLTPELLFELRRTVAMDTRLNDQLHGTIHQWFAAGEVRDLASLNERIYAELFLTPSSDPWLGLNPSSVFTAISE